MPKSLLLHQSGRRTDRFDRFDRGSAKAALGMPLYVDNIYYEKDSMEYIEKHLRHFCKVYMKK